MTASSPPRLVSCLLFVLSSAAVLAIPLRSHADRATARLLSGGIVSGEVEVYVPGVRVVIRTDSGESYALGIHELVELEIIPELPRASSSPQGVAPPAPPAPPAQVTPQAPAPAHVLEAPPGATYVLVPQYTGSAPVYAPSAGYSYTLQPRPSTQEPRGRRPSLFWPMMTLSGSALAFVSGTMLVLNASWACDSYDYGYGYDDGCSGRTRQLLGGSALMALSLPLFIITASYLLPRKVRARRRHRAAERAAQLSLAPTVDPVAGHYGVGATLRF